MVNTNAISQLWADRSSGRFRMKGRKLLRLWFLLVSLSCFPLRGALITEVLSNYFPPDETDPPAACQEIGTSSAVCSAGPLSIGAVAGFGIVGVASGTPDGTSLVFAYSSFDEMLTIDAGENPNGYVQYQFLITLEGSDDMAGAACVPAGMEVFQDGVSLGASPVISLQSCPSPFDGQLSYTFVTDFAPFTSLVPYLFSAQAFLSTINPYGSDPHLGAFNTSLLSVLTGVSVFDADGNPLPGAIITSDSGDLYPVPEPALAGPLFLAIAGSAAVQTVRRSARGRAIPG